MKTQLSLLSVLSAVALSAGAVEFRSTTFTARWQDRTASVVCGPVARPTVTLNPTATDQSVLGFGTAVSELSWQALAALDPSDRKAVLDELFSAQGGNFTVIRTPLGASDFSTGFYSYAETAGDFDLADFSIERDRKALLPLLKEILSRDDGTFKVWASPWCPPLWMKKSGAYASKPQLDPSQPPNDCSPAQQVREGEDGFLCDDAHLAAYARYFRRYIEAYRAEGVPLWMVMPQNEFNSDQVFPSCTWQAKSLATFIGKYLGPALDGSGVELHFGTMERPSLDMARTILDDSDCRKYIRGAGFQWAGKAAIGPVHARYPDLFLMQTEQECGDGRNDWRHARHAWELMRHYFTNGASAYEYWNLALEDNALSRWGWRQNSLVSVVPSARTFTYTVEYHILKQVSHYVKRGAKRIKTPEGDWLAFLNPDGSVVVVLGNAGPAREVSVALRARTWRLTVPADSVSTLLLDASDAAPRAGTKHAGNPVYPTYDGRIMAGYQGWFHNPSRGTMFPDPANVRIDMWPDVAEYEKTYPTGLKRSNGETARFFCSDDPSTVDTHFRWMKEYGLDGVFLQRFFNNATRPQEKREESVSVIRPALAAAQKYGRAVSVMWDLSGLRPGRDDCLKLIDDWKFLVDEVKVTSYGERNQYLHHRGRPLVVIWGVGFPDRPYKLDEIKLAEFIDFLHNDPDYGGCSVMLGVPTCWRTLEYDCLPDPYLHELIRKADLVLPWMVQRFTPLLHFEMDRYRDTIKKDIAWCEAAGVDYVPLIYPGFSWHNLSRHEKGIGGEKPVASIPRLGGQFYWDQAQTAIAAGAKRIYVAMFDEVNEGTAIFKVTDAPPVGDGFKMADLDGQPSDHYLFLTGEAGRLLRGEREPTAPGTLPVRTFTYAGNPFATHHYYADPSAHVWNGRLYVYPSHDIDPPRGCDLMDRYHVLSTDDLVNWIDHGEFLRADQVKWGRPEGGFMWAPDCAFKDGKYYFYYPHPSLSRWNDSWLIGVAVSDRPDGGFKDIGTIPGLGGFAMIDPCVFTDTDGQSYIYAGGGAKMVGAKLKPNMVELDGEAQPMVGLEDFHEGPWVFKRGDWYYLMYPDNHEEPGIGGQNRQHYCMAKNPLGPWEHKGIILESTGCDTSHGSIVEFKGQWYIFYHNRVFSGRGNLRTLCYDKLFFNDDGTIQPVKQTRRPRQAYWKGK